ncbi:MAG: DUF2244 domain-containing protein [Saccharospirillum sp.]
MIKEERLNDHFRLLLTPNRSMSWQGNVRILASLFAVSGLIVSVMLYVGAWLVVPFAGLELAAVTAALYYTALRCRQQEILIIEAEALRLEKGIYKLESQWELPRRYTRLVMTEPAHPWTPPALHLRHRDTEVPLAPFLNSDDNARLVQALQRQGIAIERRARATMP